MGDERADQFRLAQQSLIAFGMGENPGQLHSVQIRQARLKREIHLVRQFQQDVSHMISQAENVASAERGRQIGFDADIRAGQHFDGHGVLPQVLLQTDRGITNVISPIVSKRTQLMWRDNDRFDAFIAGDPSHFQRLSQRLCAVIDTWEQVAVNVNKGLARLHVMSSLGIERGTATRNREAGRF